MTSLSFLNTHSALFFHTTSHNFNCQTFYANMMWLRWQRHWVESLLCIRPHEMRHSWWFSQSNTHKRTDVCWDVFLWYTFHIPLQHIPCITDTLSPKQVSHTLTHEHEPPAGLRREWDESELVFHVWCGGFPASFLFGRLVCFHHTGNGSGSSEALLLFSSTNTSWHLLLPPTRSWCTSVMSEAVFVSGLTGEISSMAHREQSQHSNWQQPPYPIAPCKTLQCFFFFYSKLFFCN